MLRVVVVDDEALVRSGFSLILGADPGIQVVATATGTDALATVERERPDVVLLDIRMPEVDGLTVLAALQRWADPPVVAVLTTFDNDDYVLAALRGGAAGYLTKDTDPDRLPGFVRSLAAGAVVLGPGVSRPFLRRTAAPADDDETARLELLTTRERDVLRLVAEGLSNAEVGQRLYLGAGTVKDHVSAVLGKLRVGTRVQAALIAQRSDLLGRSAPPPASPGPAR
ncbi:response regulator [Pseudonocardia spinosispora]|uniref:response regulator n=1 Tax=Pseudonocardia spinosispora TaxID=103441 RepID=UPI00048B6700|nr:response regulator transcription factor [Pseudonocardia spinosispora]